MSFILHIGIKMELNIKKNLSISYKTPIIANSDQSHVPHSTARLAMIMEARRRYGELDVPTARYLSTHSLDDNGNGRVEPYLEWTYFTSHRTLWSASPGLGGSCISIDDDWISAPSEIELQRIMRDL